MTRKLYFVLTLAMIALLAAGAQAQQQMTQNYDDANGTDANGGINRHGEDYVGDTGPHGPIGPGPDDGLVLDLLGEMLGDGVGSGTSNQGANTPKWHWGPGDYLLVGPFGPNTGVGYGPAGVM